MSGHGAVRQDPTPPVAVASNTSADSANASAGLFWRKLIDVLLVFAPDSVKELVEKNLLRWAALAVVLFIAVPLLAAFLAAFWMSKLAQVDGTLARALRESYLSTIYEGFSIEDVARRSHSRLDYLLLFSEDLQRRQYVKDLPLRVSVGQKVIIDISVVDLRSPDPSCSIDEAEGRGVDIASISIGAVTLGTYRETRDRHIELGEVWWNKYQADVVENELMRPITIQARLPPELSCAIVHIEGGVRVFKDVYTLKAASNGP